MNCRFTYIKTICYTWWQLIITQTVEIRLQNCQPCINITHLQRLQRVGDPFHLGGSYTRVNSRIQLHANHSGDVCSLSLRAPLEEWQQYETWTTPDSQLWFELQGQKRRSESSLDDCCVLDDRSLDDCCALDDRLLDDCCVLDDRCGNHTVALGKRLVLAGRWSKYVMLIHGYLHDPSFDGQESHL